MKKQLWALLLTLITHTLPALSQRLTSTFSIQPRMRVIMDNDFSGDPDGLFALTHLLLSPSVEVRAIVGSHLKARDGFDPSKTQAENACAKAREVVALLGVGKDVTVINGSNTAMPNDSTPVKSEGVNFIIREALRTDTKLPLYMLCGAGLTEIASAVLTDPRIAAKLTLIWIGGAEYPDLAMPPPNYSSPEYNLNIDIAAARVVFNRSAIPFWQVPRDAYRQALFPYSQLLLKVKPQGRIGLFLCNALESVMSRIMPFLNIGETYILGDSPLVLLTALQSSFEADPSSSTYSTKMAPLINDKGEYAINTKGRNIRVYTHLDIPLLFNDFLAKLELLNAASHH
ncbi:MAG: nucleoside hydrolase [Bacteroidota bacterium]|nr:nucleoside hydrolase [Bacteroidota bacterium]